MATRNPLNLGAAARAMSNFGFLRLRVVNPYEVAFREARSAVGASTVLNRAEEYKDVTAAVSDCGLVVGTTAARSRELHHLLHPLNRGVSLMRKQLRSSRVALLFGSEKVGLSNEAMSQCHWLLRIPTREEHPSMNLGQAVAVCLYELARENSVSFPLAKQAPASAADLERITSILLEALRTSGYYPADASPSTDRKVRRLIRRLHFEAADADVLLGMLRQIVWKLRAEK